MEITLLQGILITIAVMIIAIDNQLIVRKIDLNYYYVTLHRPYNVDEKERLILYMRYQLDFNQEKVAQRLNISQVQVSRLEKKIITKLRKHLNELGIDYELIAIPSS